MFIVKERRKNAMRTIADVSKHGTYDEAAKALEECRKKKPDVYFYVVKRG